MAKNGIHVHMIKTTVTEEQARAMIKVAEYLAPRPMIYKVCPVCNHLGCVICGGRGFVLVH